MTPRKAAVEVETGTGYAATPPERQFKLFNSHQALDSTNIATQLWVSIPNKALPARSEVAGELQ